MAALPDPAPQGEALLRSLQMEAESRLEVLARAAREVREITGCDERLTLAALAETDLQGATAIGDGLAIPHAEVEGVIEPLALHVTLRRPVRWRDDDQQDVSECLVIVVPPGRHADHLAMTAAALRARGSDRR